jgi:hypothetical protein
MSTILHSLNLALLASPTESSDESDDPDALLMLRAALDFTLWAAAVATAVVGKKKFLNKAAMAKSKSTPAT